MSGEYKKSENTFTSKFINASAIIFTIALVILSSVTYKILWGRLPLKDYFITTSFKPFLRIIIFVIAIMIGIGTHEIFHGIGFKLYGKIPWDKVKIGVNWRMLTPYAHCSVPLKLNQYKKALLLPGIFTGIIPFVIGLATEQFLLFFGGVILISGAYGDFFICWSLRKASSQAYIENHPEKIGCYILEK